MWYFVRMTVTFYRQATPNQTSPYPLTFIDWSGYWCILFNIHHLFMPNNISSSHFTSGSNYPTCMYTPTTWALLCLAHNTIKYWPYSHWIPNHICLDQVAQVTPSVYTPIFKHWFLPYTMMRSYSVFLANWISYLKFTKWLKLPHVCLWVLFQSLFFYSLGIDIM